MLSREPTPAATVTHHDDVPVLISTGHRDGAFKRFGLNFSAGRREKAATRLPPCRMRHSVRRPHPTAKPMRAAPRTWHASSVVEAGLANGFLVSCHETAISDLRARSCAWCPPREDCVAKGRLCETRCPVLCHGGPVDHEGIRETIRGERLDSRMGRDDFAGTVFVDRLVGRCHANLQT